MPHIHTEPRQHDTTVTAYIIRTDTHQPKALVHMHRKMNMLLPVGGHVELLETPWQAIAHELMEESGYSLAELCILQPVLRITQLSDALLHPYPVSMNTHSITHDHFHSDISYAFVASADPMADVGKGESVDLRWVTQTELNDLDNTLIHTNTKQVYNFIFNEAFSKWDKIAATDFVLEFTDNLLD